MGLIEQLHGTSPPRAKHELSSPSDATDYVAIEDEGSSSSLRLEPLEPLGRWCLTLLVLLFAVGAHASGHALMPLAPALEHAGVSPMAYALMTLVPTVGQIVLPAVWGATFSQFPRATMVLAPTGLMLGQMLMAAGLWRRQESDGEWGASTVTLLGIGTLIYSACRAGIGVLQHTAMALVLPSSLVAGLCLQVGLTHVIGAAVTYGVPHVLGAHGLLGVQLALLLPAAVGALAGVVLARTLPQVPCAPFVSPAVKRYRRSTPLFFVHCPLCGVAVPRHLPYNTMCDNCRKAEAHKWRSRQLLLLLGVWRAGTLGVLHAFSAVTNTLLVQHAFTISSAGAFSATTSAGSLVVLPAVVLGARLVPACRLMRANTAFVLLGAVLLVMAEHAGGPRAAWVTGVDADTSAPHRSHVVGGGPGGGGALGRLWLWWAPRAGLSALALGGTAGPVLLLAIVPTIGGQLGRAYGELEALSIFGQVGITLLMGWSRAAAGFRGALWVLFVALLGGNAAAAAFNALASTSVEVAPSDGMSPAPRVRRRASRERMLA